MGPMSAVLLVLHEQEPTSNTLDERIGHNAPDLNHTERESEVWGQVEGRGRGTVAGKPPEVLPHTHNDHQLGRHHTVQPRSFKRKSQFHGNILHINILTPERDHQDPGPRPASIFINSTIGPADIAEGSEDGLGPVRATLRPTVFQA